MVFEILSEGKEYARTGRDLCDALGLTARELTSRIEKERRAGHPICASTGATPGYFLAANRDEMQRYCKSLQHRAGELYKTRRACMNTIDKLPPGEA